MAVIFGKKLKEENAEKKPETTEPKRKPSPEKMKKIRSRARKRFAGRVINVAAGAVEAADEINEEVAYIGKDGWQLLLVVCAAFVSGIDRAIEILEWAFWRVAVLAGRKWYDFWTLVIAYKRTILKHGIIVVMAAVGMVAVFAAGTDYQYSYNGRPLGIVREQKDVLEVLDIVSDELSLEYGAKIEIDPETDIEFTPVVSYGKDIDDVDTILRRFTYMGDIQATACAIKADGNIVAIVENEEAAEDVLEAVKQNYMTDDSVEYLSAEFEEDIELEEYNTTLANISSPEAATRTIELGGERETTYTVKAGDSIYSIAETLGISQEQLIAMNPELGEGKTLYAGDQVISTEAVPLLTVKTVEIATFAESIDFETEYKTSSYYYEGESITTREGKKGKASITARVTRSNGKIVAREDLEKEVLIEPVNKVITQGTKKMPPKQGTGTFIRPVNVSISSGFGYRWGRQHLGVDLPAHTGTGIKAADGGTVVMAGWYYGYGLTVQIDHGRNTKTLYGHCSKIYVSVGQKVAQGQTIAAVGTTGNVTGPHCHFEIIINGQHVNPAGYI